MKEFLEIALKPFGEEGLWKSMTKKDLLHLLKTAAEDAMGRRRRRWAVVKVTADFATPIVRRDTRGGD